MSLGISVVLSTICLVLLPETLPAGGGTEPVPANPRAVIEYSEGDVLVDGRPAEIGQEVALGADVRTGENSTCIIVFGGKNIFRIQELSSAVIRIDEEQGSIDLARGALAAVFDRLQRLSGSGGAFRIQTPTAVAGVRGTAFFIKVEDQNNTYVCTCNGKLGLEDVDQGNSRSVRATHHRSYRFTRGADGITTSRVRMMYHTDSDITSLASQIGVRLPWKSSSKSGGGGMY
jgi:hypothetical protein